MIKEMTSKVANNLNMFDPFIKDKVVCNLNNTLVVIVNRSETRKRNTHISK